MLRVGQRRKFVRLAGGTGGAGGSFPSFLLPLNDLGAGVVNLVPAIAAGSPTPTFTRATTAYTKLANGLQGLVGIGVARSGYLGFNDTVTAYGGFFSEGASTNLLLWSNDLTNAAWVKTTMTTALTSTGPDGVPNSATRVTATAGNALCLQTIVAAASSRTLSFWVRRITGAGNFDLTQDGIGFTTVATTAAWTQVPSLTASVLNATCGFRVVANGDAFDIWCGQFEAGAFVSSPIPTTTVAATRNTDVLTYVTAGNIIAANGSAYIEAWAPSLQFNRFILGNGTFPLYGDATRHGLMFDGTNILNTGASLLSVVAVNKLASSWGGANQSIALNGNTSATGAFDGVMNLGVNFTVGSIGQSMLKNLQIRPTTLSGAQLQAQTT